MNYANIKYNAVEDGAGVRTVLFVSGCRNCCEGCFQPQTWDFSYGNPFTAKARQDILDSLQEPYIRGLTLCGGEPFEPENQEELLSLLQDVRTLCPQSDVWAYSGLTWESLSSPYGRVATRFTVPLLRMIDVLVDGPFLQNEKSLLLPYRGSSNQRIIDLPRTMNEGRVILSPWHEKHVLHAPDDENEVAWQ